jgi:hypothetical protein
MDLKQNCEICENSNSIHVKYKTDNFIREFDFCRECKSDVTYIIEQNFVKMSKELNVTLYPKKGVNDIICCIIRNSLDIDATCYKINDVLDEIINKYKYDSEYYVPFDNVKLLDCENNFCCFTTNKRMNKFIKDDSVEIISEKVIKWKSHKIHNRNFIFQIAENNMKENRCFNCESTKYLKTLSIFPNKKNLSIFLKDNILIHFFFAFCSKCRDDCIINREICNEQYKNLLNSNCDEYIEQLYKNNECNKIMDFINEYIQKFKDLMSK